MPAKILLVDDDPFQIKVARVVLERAGCQVIPLLSRAGGASEIHDRNFDLALIDVMMPEIDGDRLLELVRRYRDEVHAPLVLLSSMPKDEIARRAARAGADGWLQKPLTSEAVAALLERFDLEP